MARAAVKDFGTCLNMGPTGGVTMGNPTALQITETITIAAWVKLKSDTTSFQVVMGKINAGNTSAYVLLTDTTARRFIFQVRIGGVAKSTPNSTTALVPGNWYFVTGVYDGSAVKLYVNGEFEVELGNTTGSIENLASSNFVVGRNGSAGVISRMYVDELRVWSTPLSATQVRSLYSNNIVPSGLAGEWLCDEGSGTTLTDSTANGNNGTITSSTYSTNVPVKPRVSV